MPQRAGRRRVPGRRARVRAARGLARVAVCDGACVKSVGQSYSGFGEAVWVARAPVVQSQGTAVEIERLVDPAQSSQCVRSRGVARKPDFPLRDEDRAPTRPCLTATAEVDG